MNHEITTGTLNSQKTKIFTNFTFRAETSISLILLGLTLGISLFQIVLLIMTFETMIATLSISVVSLVTSLMIYGSIVIEYNTKR